MTYIKDDEFIRGNCPMTKEEVRVLSISKLELEKDYNMIDVGAGTGSISIQSSRICSLGHIVAVEKDPEALEVLRRNREKFNAENLEIVEGEAVECAESIKGLFDAVFIGGSGGNIEDIIKKYSEKLKVNRKIVLNFITVDNLYRALNALKGLDFETECIQVSISMAKGKSHMLIANNPIFIISGRKTN